ncbi:hypothetical protein L1987_57679 [Smallanthus sonchifolius]|uniref:Uncharacterized protein n=1 Tax=Smallanthus sonchifolius TaxID=185202 RepID=A0ACB9DDT4_9ASTR|nr:hypothetical protein L1987_57679 [Smallanthus sonchifolius]
MKEVLDALNKGKYVPPPHSSALDSSSTHKDDKDTKIKALEAKVDMLEAQVVGLQGQLDMLQKKDDFQLKAYQENAKSLATQHTIINKQQKEILLNKRQLAKIQILFMENNEVSEVSQEDLQDQFHNVDELELTKPVSPTSEAAPEVTNQEETPKLYKNTV